MSQDALGVIEAACEEHKPSHLFALFSGGHDSLAATALAAKHPYFTAAVHINTGIGIEETREFVRETCRSQNWPLVEMHPDGKTYRDLVSEFGMPSGPKSHNTSYYWLKQRQIRRLVKENKVTFYDRIGLITGIRKDESVRRMSAVMSVPVHRWRAQLWINPILDWSAIDCSDFMEQEGLKRNPVVDLLHRSGECLCGAYAHYSERKEIAAWFPKADEEIKACEAIARSHNHRDDVWAARQYVPAGQMHLCTDCEEFS